MERVGGALAFTTVVVMRMLVVYVLPLVAVETDTRAAVEVILGGVQVRALPRTCDHIVVRHS